MNLAVQVENVSHSYGRRQAIVDLTFAVQRREIFALLGPNGGGKTTLFRLLSTLVPLQQGSVTIFAFPLRGDLRGLRQRIGVVFQAPSLDRKLTVRENIRHQAALYGIRGAELAEREAELLEQLGIADRGGELVETLSGGLRRRVELAKGMIHRPPLLLMDEPSTGLDPGARADLWRYLVELRDGFGVTVLMTTHLLEEAEKADRIAILNAGELVALDTPEALRATVGGDSITIASDAPEQLANEIRAQFDVAVQVLNGQIRLEQPDAGGWIARLVAAFPERIQAITLAKPTLEDVFIDRTGHRFWAGEDDVDD